MKYVSSPLDGFSVFVWVVNFTYTFNLKTRIIGESCDHRLIDGGRGGGEGDAGCVFLTLISHLINSICW